jgi:hypothetical protein
MSKKNVICPSCGFGKNPPGATRCASCGTKIDDESLAQAKAGGGKAMQQEGIDVLWTVIATVVQALLTGAIIFGLPAVVGALDFEGGNGMVSCIPIWFVGGVIVGLISPGRTFLEPVIGSFVVAIPTTYLLVQSQTVRVLPTFLYVVMAAIGVLFTLIGSYLGERIQLGPAPKAAPAA